MTTIEYRQTHYRHVIETELQKLNDKIDLKIVFGQNYSDDARRHKMLKEQAKKLRKKRYGSLFPKILSKFMSPFSF